MLVKLAIGIFLSSSVTELKDISLIHVRELYKDGYVLNHALNN